MTVIVWIGWSKLERLLDGIILLSSVQIDDDVLGLRRSKKKMLCMYAVIRTRMGLTPRTEMLLQRFSRKHLHSSHPFSRIHLMHRINNVPCQSL